MRTWADIRFEALAANLALLHRALPPAAELLLPVKADAYGHGALIVARWAEELGVRWLGVASVGEAMALRAGGVRTRLLLFGPLPHDAVSELRAFGVTPTLCDCGDAERWAAEAPGTAAHVEIDTGMGRAGFDWRRKSDLQRLARTARLSVEGAYTHFASAEDDAAFTRLQHDRFRRALGDLARHGLDVPLVHLANSAALLRHGWMQAGLARPGIAAYAPHPCHGADGPGWRPVLEWRAQVVQVRRLEPGDTAGYGRTARVERPTTAALLGVGYGDGYSRAHAREGFVHVRGVRCPVLGRVSMDLTLVDANDVPDVAPGDTAILLGDADGVGAHDLAVRLGTIAYEVLTSISGRVPRVARRDEHAAGAVGTESRAAGTRA